MYALVITTLVLLFVMVSIITQWLPMIAIGLLTPLLLSVFRVIDPATAYSGLCSTTTFLIVGALVLGDACFRTGLTHWIGRHVIRYTGRFTNESIKLLLISLLAAGMSAFLSSLGVQVALLALIVLMSQTLQISKTRALMALGYSATLGGMWTVIGTTLMVMGKSAYEDAVPGGTIGMFEITRVSLPIGLAAILFYCFVLSRRQPDRAGNAMAADGTEVSEPPLHRRNATITAVVFLAFIVLVALDGRTPLPANLVTILVLLVLGGTRVCTPRQMAQCINWDVLFFIVGITVLSGAMAASGLSQLLGELLMGLIGDNAPPRLIIALVAILSALLTQVMSNSGAFGVVLPFLPTIADSTGIALKPLIVTACIACTCGFCLPLATPTYCMLGQEGNIRVTDWLLRGLPMLALCLVLTVLLVPAAFPLY